MLPNLEYSIRFKTFSPRWNTGTHVQESWYGPNSAVQLKVMQHVASVKRKLLGERLLVVNFRLFACSHHTICHLVYLKFCVIRWYNRGWTLLEWQTNTMSTGRNIHWIFLPRRATRMRAESKTIDRGKQELVREKRRDFSVCLASKVYIFWPKRGFKRYGTGGSWPMNE
jgi:hypothetical protein